MRQVACWVIACLPISQNTIGTANIKFETTSLLMAKQIDIGSVLSTSYCCDLTTDSAIKEWDAPLVIITKEL